MSTNSTAKASIFHNNTSRSANLENEYLKSIVHPWGYFNARKLKQKCEIHGKNRIFLLRITLRRPLLITIIHAQFFSKNQILIEIN